MKFVNRYPHYDMIGEKWNNNLYYEFRFKIPFINYGVFMRSEPIRSSLGGRARYSEYWCIRKLSKMRVHVGLGKWIKDDNDRWIYARVNPLTEQIEP